MRWQSGDTLWAIAQQYYGDGSLAWQLAGYNGIQNANLIYPGDIVKLPERSAVEASSYSGARQTAPGAPRPSPPTRTPVLCGPAGQKRAGAARR